MEDLLDNPVYNALITGDASLSNGTDKVKYFDEAVSPFAGFPVNYENGFKELYEMLLANRKILYATTQQINEPEGWEQLAYIKGVQFVFDHIIKQSTTLQPVPLNHEYVNEMVQLATLTKPGPFNNRTIDFGSYYGIFQNGKLVAMTGQRLHVSNYTEISAVCTHPDYLGKGYATILLQHQLYLICNQGQIPFLHVREDNTRAIDVYERLGFTLRGPMHFYFLRRKS